MQISGFKKKLQTIYAEKQLDNERRRLAKQGKGLLLAIFRTVLIIGLSYVILGPLIGIIANSFFSNADKYSPMVYIVPQAPTLERYQLAIIRMDYWNTLLNMMIYVISLTLMQIGICSMVGYGFARYNFPFKKILFACVIIMIVIPTHSVMLPLYTTFMSFSPIGLGIFVVLMFAAGFIFLRREFPFRNLFFGLTVVGILIFTFIFLLPINPTNTNALTEAVGSMNSNLLRSSTPMYIMTALGTGLRAGLYIYIFNQFFRGLPKEIEEAAEIDGAGTIRTFVRVMMPNAMPAIITVTIFSIVWQYNDTFFSNLFLIPADTMLSKQITSLQANIQAIDRIMDPSITALYTYAGIVLVIIPVVILYVLLQKQFIEGVERSGIVG
jgi:multiple sugar transport system permease protein